MNVLLLVVVCLPVMVGVTPALMHSRATCKTSSFCRSTSAWVTWSPWLISDWSFLQYYGTWHMTHSVHYVHYVLFSWSVGCDVTNSSDLCRFLHQRSQFCAVRMRLAVLERVPSVSGLGDGFAVVLCHLVKLLLRLGHLCIDEMSLRERINHSNKIIKMMPLWTCCRVLNRTLRGSRFGLFSKCKFSVGQISKWWFQYSKWLIVYLEKLGI